MNKCDFSIDTSSQEWLNYQSLKNNDTESCIPINY